MRYQGKTVSDLNIAYIGGGSKGWAWTFMADLSLEESLSGTVRLYDIDQEAANRNKVIGNAMSADPDRVGKWNYTVAETLKDALVGADFVVISILPGTFEEMRSDVHLPEIYGLYQSVGDTAGPGGLVRALRTIPMFVTIAQAIKEYSPRAWVINYTNPMALCVKTLYTVYPQIKAFGCCHEVFGTQHLLAEMCKELLGVKAIDRSDIHVNVLGVNHFTWFNRASYQTEDLFPLFQEFSDKYYEEGCAVKDDNWMNSPFECSHRVKFDLFRRYGLIAAAGDRHLAEFLPPTYLRDPDTAIHWGFKLTTVDWRLKDLKQRREKSDRYLTGMDTLSKNRSNEEGILLIKSLLGLTRTISNVNTPNVGQIPNLPLGTVVETNALFERDHIAPVYAGEIPENILALISPHAENQNIILEAALTCDRSLALKAFLREPLVTLKETQAKELLEEMLNNTKAYLPKKWFQ